MTIRPAAAHQRKQPSVEPELVCVGRGAPLRVLVFTEHFNATCYISFERPLRLLHAQGRADFAIASQQRVKSGGHACWRRWMTRLQPDVVVMTRYAQPFGDDIVADAKHMGAVVVYHIDDNLLELPTSLGTSVVQTHGSAEVVGARLSMLKGSDLVYASTPYLASILRDRLPGQHVVSGDIYCTYEALKASTPASPPIIGYMGSRGHQEDLALVVPALRRLLTERPTLRFEVFGSIPLPAELVAFGHRVRSHTVQKTYPEFLRALAGLRWSIGLAPLVNEPFNRCKAPTKYIEYTSAGIPTLASRAPVYGQVMSKNCGQLVDDDWYEAMKKWLDEPTHARVAVNNARSHCAFTYAVDHLAKQLDEILVQALRQKATMVVRIHGVSSQPIAAAVLRETLASHSVQRVRIRDTVGALPYDNQQTMVLEQWGVTQVSAERTGPSFPTMTIMGTTLGCITDPLCSPWRFAEHPLASGWTLALQSMLNTKHLAPQDICKAVKKRELRPSLLGELGLMPGGRGPLRPLMRMLASAADRLSGFHSCGRKEAKP